MFLINLAATIVLEYLVLMVFFRKEKLSLLQFTALLNGITLAAASYLFNQQHVDWMLIEAGTTLIEAAVIYLYWDTGLPKAILASVVANAVSAGFFPLLQYLGLFPF